MYNDMPEDTYTYIVQIEDHEFMDEDEGKIGVYLCYYTNADMWGFNSDTLGDVESHGVFDDLDEAKEEQKNGLLKPLYEFYEYPKKLHKKEHIIKAVFKTVQDEFGLLRKIEPLKKGGE